MIAGKTQTSALMFIAVVMGTSITHPELVGIHKLNSACFVQSCSAKHYNEFRTATDRQFCAGDAEHIKAYEVGVH